VEMKGISTHANLKILPLGSYDVFIGMDWLETYKVTLDCYNKTFDYTDENGNSRTIKGIPKTISTRKNSAL
jgi:hypothetical protein